MHKPFLFILIMAVPLISCRNNPKITPTTDTDVATTFIRDILDNRLDDAVPYLLNDESNLQYFDTFREQYRKKEKAELDKYRAAEIIINEISNFADTVSIVNYSNTYKKELKNNLKLVRINGKWLVDLKYTFLGNL